MAARSELLIAYGKSVWPPPCTTFLHKNVYGVSALVDGTPKIMELTTDLDKDLVQIPCVTQPALSFLKLLCVFRPESIAPLPNGFIRDGNATFSQKVFNISQAQTETMVQPHSVTDDGRRKSVSMV